MIAKLLLPALLLATVPAWASDTGRSYITKDRTASRAALPFSEAVRVGKTLYVAGHIGIDPATEQAASNVDVEARAVMDAVKATVEQAGYKMDDLVSVTVYCTDLALYDTFNSAYRTYFHEKYPARAFIGVAKLLRGAHFEVMGVAVKSAG